MPEELKIKLLRAFVGEFGNCVFFQTFLSMPPHSAVELSLRPGYFSR